MQRDLSVAVRSFVVTALADDTAVAALTAERVYGPSPPATPQWPFIRSDLPAVTPDPDGCGPNGQRYTFNVHGFAKGDDERTAGQLANAMVARLDELSGILVDVDPEAAITDTVWTGTQIFRDTPEPNGWHAVVSIYCRVSA